MNKKITTLTFVALLTALSGCGSSDSTTSATGTDTTTDSTTDSNTDVTTEPVVDITDLLLGTGTGTSFVNSAITVGIGSATLSSSGSTTISVNIVDGTDSNSQYFGLVNVYFTSTCVQAGFAEFTPSQLQASGSATATYLDKGCGKVLGSDDNISVSIVSLLENGDIDLANPRAAAAVTISVAAAEVGAIQFVQALPDVIALRGVGSDTLPELSVVEFKVVDTSSNPMSEREVTFELDHDIGGVELSRTTTITDQDGIARVQLQSGLANGNVRVIANVQVPDPDNAGQLLTVTTQSNPIAMSTGLGDENSFSLSATSFNPAAFNFDGTTVDINVRLADHFNNPVPDGTRVSFTTTGGFIEGSCGLVAGACTAKWTSSDPRPIDGVVTITARTVGQGNFQDTNSNGMYDIDEVYQPYPEVFIDANGNGTFDEDATYQPLLDIDGDGDDDDPSNVNNEFHWDNDTYVANNSDGTTRTSSVNFFEEFFDFNNDGDLTPKDDKKYQGINCSDEAIAANHCEELVDISASLRLQMSSSNDAFFEGPFAWSDALGRYDTSTTVSCVDTESQSQRIAWRVADSTARRNHLAAGTKISFVTDDLDIISASGTGDVGSFYPAPPYNAAWIAAWAAEPSNATRTDADRKYDYLNLRGHLIEATVIRPDTVVTTTGLGTIQPTIDTVHGGGILGAPVSGNLTTPTYTLVEGTALATSADVSGGTETYTIYINNSCGLGLDTDNSLSITATNGTLDNISITEGGAGTATAIVNNSTSISIDSTDATIVSFDIIPDGASSLETDGLSLTIFDIITLDNGSSYSVPTTTLSYDIQD